MTDHDLYQQILGLTAPWRVSDVELRIDDEEVLVHVVHDVSRGQALCPECHKACPGYDTSRERRWRHLDTCQLKTYLICSVPRVSCPEHGVHVAYVPWSDPGSGFTSAFEALGITVLRATIVQSRAAQLLRLSDTQVHDLMHRAVQRGLLRRDGNLIMTNLAIDEKSIQRGHSYATILSDTEHQRVVEIVEDRTLAAAENLLCIALSQAQKACVRSVSMDMWPAFQKALRSVLPDADHVHDRYHVVAYLANAVDQTRRSEHSRLSKAGDRTLNKTKYIWLKNPENMTPKQKELFENLSTADLETPKVWAFKDTFKEFFGCKDIEQAKAFFDNWFQSAIELNNRFLTKVATMLREHLDGLLNYIKHRTSNANAERLNGSIQHIKASARGYRKFASFRIAVLFHLGKLDLYPHKSL
ncbi:MAG TPA: ISL3 family transposase [Capsulimonadaceae bacterium]|jgi:transposase